MRRSLPLLVTFSLYGCATTAPVLRPSGACAPAPLQGEPARDRDGLARACVTARGKAEACAPDPATRRAAIAQCELALAYEVPFSISAREEIMTEAPATASRGLRVAEAPTGDQVWSECCLVGLRPAMARLAGLAPGSALLRVAALVDEQTALIADLLQVRGGVQTCASASRLEQLIRDAKAPHLRAIAEGYGRAIASSHRANAQARLLHDARWLRDNFATTVINAPDAPQLTQEIERQLALLRESVATFRCHAPDWKTEHEELERQLVGFAPEVLAAAVPIAERALCKQEAAARELASPRRRAEVARQVARGEVIGPADAIVEGAKRDAASDAQKLQQLFRSLTGRQPAKGGCAATLARKAAAPKLPFLDAVWRLAGSP